MSNSLTRHVWRAPRIIGTGMTTLRRTYDPNATPTILMKEALDKALNAAKMDLHELDALIALPSLSHPVCGTVIESPSSSTSLMDIVTPSCLEISAASYLSAHHQHFMEAHHFATKIGLLPHQGLILRTVDTGGAGPITALLEAKRMIANEHVNKIAIVGGDCVSSMPIDKFLERADAGCRNSADPDQQSPVIPHGYDVYAQYQLQKYASSLKREHFAMVPVLMSHFGIKHPSSMMYGKEPETLDNVLNSRKIAPITNLLECARRADGGAAVIVASTGYVKQVAKEEPDVDVMILGGGEKSGPLYPPRNRDEICDEIFSCEMAATVAFRESNLETKDIDWFGLYDCFPITLIRALESVGICEEGQGGEYIEKFYKLSQKNGTLDPNDFPINTHGGLLMFGAPWEVPAMYSILEAVDQIMGNAKDRQVSGCRRALCYGNGGIFSHSSVAILSQPVA